MAQRIFWSNVGIDVQSAAGSAITITAISKTKPATVTYSGSPATPPANGDVVELEVNGMHQVSARAFRIANVNTTAKTFELEGEDATTYDTFVNGTFRIITLGASFTSVQNINVTGGDFKKADLTTVHDANEKQAPTTVSAMTMDMTNFFDLTDPGWIECNKAFKSKTTRVVQLRFGTGARMLLTGYCGAAGVPSGQAQQAVMTKVSIDAQNMPTTYSS